jgi:hypothetical protein
LAKKDKIGQGFWEKTYFAAYMIRILTLLLFAAPSLAAQTFFPSPGPVLEQEVALQLANECTLFFNNPSGDTLQLRWRKLELNLPPDWDIDLCDYGHCYGGIPNNATMNPVYDTIQPYLKLIVQPGDTPGAAWLWFRVYELSNPDNYQDVYFSLHTPGVTGTTENASAGWRVFPNPAADWLYLENSDAADLPVSVYNNQGGLFDAVEIPRGARVSLPVGDWPTGVYWLRAASEMKKVIIRR